MNMLWSPKGVWRVWTSLMTLLIVLLSACGTAGDVAGTDLPTASDQTDATRRARVRLELASAYFGRGQTATALDELKQALAVNPNMSEAYNLRGLIYASLGEERLADESFRYALQLNERDADTMHNYGWYLCQRRQYPEAAALFVRALAQPNYRQPVRTWLARGVCEARAGQLAPAERSLMHALELDPSNPVTAVNFSEVLYRRGQYERARFYIRRVNANADYINAQTLWLAIRIEHRLGNAQGVNDLSAQMRNRFPQSREVSALERRAFDE